MLGRKSFSSELVIWATAGPNKRKLMSGVPQRLASQTYWDAERKLIKSSKVKQPSHPLESKLYTALILFHGVKMMNLKDLGRRKKSEIS